LREIPTHARKEGRTLGACEERKKERVGVRVFEDCREPRTKHPSNVIAITSRISLRGVKLAPEFARSIVPKEHAARRLAALVEM
jgi:hypothetical protein